MERDTVQKDHGTWHEHPWYEEVWMAMFLQQWYTVNGAGC